MIEIIKIKSKDNSSLNLLCEITKEIWAQYFADFISQKSIENLLFFAEKDVIKDEINLDNYNYYFIKKDSCPIGYFEIHKKEDFLILSQIYLLKEHGKTGCGRYALEFINRFAIEEGIKLIKTYPVKYDKELIKFFEYFKFKKNKEMSIFVGNKTYIDTIEMYRVIK